MTQQVETELLRPRQTARRDRIIQAALELAKDREFDKVQMRDIAASADVALGTVYRYFPSKDLLLANVFEAWCEGYWARLDRPTVGVSNATRLIEISMRSVEAYEREPRLLMLSTTLGMSPDPTVKECLDRVRDQAHGFLLRNIDGIPQREAAAIADILLAVTGSKLHLWQAGRMPVELVYSEVEQCVWLLLEFRDPQSAASGK
jgi:AcrR family transcriptional regulator